MTTAYDRYQSALSHKDSIRLENYAYTVWIPREKKIKVVSFLKWIWKTKIEYHPETRHNHDLYNHDLHLAEKALEVAEREAINELSPEVSAARTKYANLSSTNSSLTSSVNSKYTENCNLNREITTNRQIKANQEHRAIVLEEKNAESKARLEGNAELCQEAVNSAYEMLAGITEAERAELVIQLFNDEYFQSHILEHIMQLGCDLGRVAGYAIDNNMEDLLNLAITNGLNTDQEKEGAGRNNIIIKAIMSNSAFLQTILESTHDFSCTLAIAISEGNTEILDVILRHNPGFAYLKQGNLQSMSLLHFAVAANSLNAVEFLLNHQSEAIQSLIDVSSYGERPIQVALRKNNEECIRLLAEHTNLETELVYLIDKENTEEALECITKLVELYPDSATDSVAYHALQKGNEAAARILLNSENYIGALSIAISDRAYEVKDKLIEIKNELFPEVDEAEAAQDYRDIDQLMGDDLLDLDYQDFALGENSYEIMHYQQ